MALEAAGSNKVFLYLRLLESQVKAELSHWCNDLTWAGRGCWDSHQTDKDVHKRIYIDCHRVYRFLSGTYRCNINAHAQQHTNRTHKHTLPFIFTFYATKLTQIWVISSTDSGLDLRYWMTRGNHIEPRYDQIQRHPLMLCTETELDPVLTHNTGSKLIISAAHIAFGRQHNPITSILFLTKTIHGCETESVFLCVHAYTNTFLLHISV